MLADFLIYHRQNLATYSTDEPLISSFKNGRSKLRASVKLRGYCKPNPLNCNLPNVTSQHIDFLPDLKERGFLLKTVKPDRKDVLSGIDISIMHCATLSTSPSSYSKICSTFRTTATYFKAVRAGLGSVSLIYDL